MRILLLLDETWNDKRHPNNNMTNWFSNFPDVEVYNISGGPGEPLNRCCKDYFQVSDKDMLKSLFSRKKAGKILHYEKFPIEENEAYTPTESFVYNNRKRFSFPFMRLARSIIWRFGRYDRVALKAFIAQCNPDIIFSTRMGSVKMCRMEKIVCSMTKAPIVAYTGDDEYTLRRISFSLTFWLHRFWTRAWLRKMIPQYSLFYAQSQTQMQEFTKLFGVKTKFLVKCGNFKEEKIHESVHTPIRLIYAGKLYCNRWKTLRMIARVLRELNEDGVKVVLNIYTADALNKKMRKALHDERSSFVHGAVSAEELKKIYQENDIALHVESFDLKNRLATKYSFSTKVMDCLSSGCATMAICWEKHAAYEYLKNNDIALTANGKEELTLLLKSIITSPNLVSQYALKARSFGQKYHDKTTIQDSLRKDFIEVISKK